jgi:hypothetical protein
MLLAYFGDASRVACQAALEQLDRNGAQAVLDIKQQVRTEVVESIVGIIHRHALSERFKSEQVPSDRPYPTNYHDRPLEAQVTQLRKIFPSLGGCLEKLGRKPLPEGAEAWFAIPRWQALAPTYNEAVERVLEALAARRKFDHRLLGRVGPEFLRQSDRSILAQEILADQQQGQDIFVVAAQAGMLHRGCSARRARVAMAGNEFGLGVFAVACLLLTHPERLSSEAALMIDCSGDEYSFRGDGAFDRVPLLDFGISGIEFSIFYEDRARDLWGTPSGFLFKMS